MQITQTQPETLMLHQSLASSAHQAVLAARPDLAEADQSKAVPSLTPAHVNPTNSLDILV